MFSCSIVINFLIAKFICLTDRKYLIFLFLIIKLVILIYMKFYPAIYPCIYVCVCLSVCVLLSTSGEDGQPQRSSWFVSFSFFSFACFCLVLIRQKVINKIKKILKRFKACCTHIFKNTKINQHKSIQCVHF